MDNCPEFKGNADFYSIGIRIGVYLQWVSAWITFLLDPELAQATFDTNSIFVFAIIIAAIIAAREGADVIEMYLMLQFMLGFFVTTLSTLGVRLWLMSPDRLEKFLKIMKRRLKPIRRRMETRWSRRNEMSLREWLAEWALKIPAPKLLFTFKIDSLKIAVAKTWAPTVWHGLYQLWHFPMELPLNVLLPLKPSGLSWSGVVWRTATATMMAAYNLAFWFGSGSSTQQPARPGCGPPYIFLFSKQQLQGSVVVFCHVAAVIIAVFVFPAALILLLLTIRLFFYACLFLCRDLISWFSPQALESLREIPLNRVNTLLERQGISSRNALQRQSPLSLFSTAFNSTMDVLEFFATPKGKGTRLSNVLKVCVSLGKGEVTAKDAKGGQPLHGGGLNLGWKGARLSHGIFCLVWNACVVLSIAWFIASIELTIRWNNIRDVNTIGTTGQLIPCIIGGVSASQVVKNLILLLLAKIFPDWADVKLEVEGGVDGPAFFQIVKNEGDDDIRDGQTEGVVTTKPTRRCSV